MPIDNQEEDCPEGFMWTCCSEAGDAGGCNAEPYVEREALYKRARY